jgi:hypothetical protein
MTAGLVRRDIGIAKRKECEKADAAISNVLA